VTLLPARGRVEEFLKANDHVTFGITSDDIWISVKIDVVDQDLSITFD
jgi:hypothetical protein